jgi:hypothetical protein
VLRKLPVGSVDSVSDIILSLRYICWCIEVYDAQYTFGFHHGDEPQQFRIQSDDSIHAHRARCIAKFRFDRESLSQFQSLSVSINFSLSISLSLSRVLFFPAPTGVVFSILWRMLWILGPAGVDKLHKPLQNTGNAQAVSVPQLFLANESPEPS